MSDTKTCWFCGHEPGGMKYPLFPTPEDYTALKARPAVPPEVVELVADLMQKIDDLCPDIGMGPSRQYFMDRAMDAIAKANGEGK